MGRIKAITASAITAVWISLISRNTGCSAGWQVHLSVVYELRCGIRHELARGQLHGWAGAASHLGRIGVAHRIERRLFGGRDASLPRNFQCFPIQIISVLADPQVQMGAGGKASGANKADALALTDTLTLLHQPPGEVQVLSFEPVGVLDGDQITGAPGAAGEYDSSVCHRLHRSTGGRGIIGAEVRPELLQDRVKSAA